MAPMEVPKSEGVVNYATASSEPNKGALLLYGDPLASKMVLLCAGFDDDHRIFQPFAKSLSEKDCFCGVMCMPGYDDRPEDGVPWTSHKEGGYTSDEVTNAVREAAKALRSASKNKEAGLVGIFHDWGVVPGTRWAYRLEAEGLISDHQLDRIVFFDVLGHPRGKHKDIPKDRIQSLSIKERFCRIYQLLFAITFFIYRSISKHIAVVFVNASFLIMMLLGVSPLYSFDAESKGTLYDSDRNQFRMIYMMYPYFNMISSFAKEGFFLHKDWKRTPVLYLYGKKKRTQFHVPLTVAMLEREHAEGRSISNAIGVQDAGHWLYIQKRDECLEHVLDFIHATK